MTQTLDPVDRSISRRTSNRHAAKQHQSHRSTKVCGLSDRQAVIAAMVANGATCQDIAFELLLPLRTVQGHLFLAMRVLNVSKVEDITYAVIAEHQAKSLATASRRSERLVPVEPNEPIDSDFPTNSLVALDVAEADTDASLDESTQVAGLMVELAAARAEIDAQHRKVQQLHEAVASRDSIGQAKGILMERHKISAAAAFEVLQSESNRSNRRLADVAKGLVFSGEEAPGRHD